MLASGCMSRRVSRRKEPSREKHAIKEQLKIEEGVLDTRSMGYLSKFFNKGIVSKLEFKIASGKEADVYVADSGHGVPGGAPFVILKFFRVETSLFLNMQDYILGDPRFHGLGKSKTEVVRVWCMKEFGNLRVASEHGVSVPRPLMAHGSILAMEFIGDEYGTAAPTLNRVRLEEPDMMLDDIMRSVRLLYRAQLVHADLSEYNVLVSNGRHYLIDLGQAVSVKHPRASEFLGRDVRNMLDYFRKEYSCERDLADALSFVTAESA